MLLSEVVHRGASNENTGLRAIASNFQRNFLEVKVRPLDAPDCRTE